MVEDQIGSTVDKVMSDVRDINVLSVSGIIRVLPHIIKLVQQFKNLKGFEKKQLAINTLTELITRLSPTDVDLSKAYDFLHEAGDSLIDVFVFAAKSKDMIKKTKKHFKNLCMDACPSVKE